MTNPPFDTTAETTFLLELANLVSLMMEHSERVKQAGLEWHGHEAAAKRRVELANGSHEGEVPEGIVNSTSQMVQCQGQVWVGVDGFLSAWARASLILFPAPAHFRSDEEKVRAHARGAYLREVLEIEEDHPIQFRHLRDAWTHFDERLDAALHDHGRVRLQHFHRADEAVPSTAPVMRDLDLTNLIVTVEDHSHQLRTLFDACADLKTRVDGAIESLSMRRRAEIQARAERDCY